MVKVNETSFNNLVNMNLDAFYNSLSSDDKAKLTQSDQIALAEVLKKSKEYQSLEQALKILVKCNSNLHDSVLKERAVLANHIDSI